MASRLRTRPSELYGLKDKVTSWCFDRAVQTFGEALEAAMRKAAEGEKNQKAGERAAERVFLKWLYSDTDGGAPQRFRNPMPGAVRRR